MKRALFAIVLVLFPLLALAQFDPAEHPNVEKGFSPEKVYQFGDLDSVNLFNGNVLLMIPIGGSYRVGPSLEYKFRLAYNAKMWDHASTDGGTLAQPLRTANAGLGWQVSFGRVLTPQSPENNSFQYLYVDQSGLQHKMSHQLHKNDTKYDCTISGLACDPSGPLKVLYTNDNTYLRLVVKRDNTMTVDTPDGVTMTFDTDGRLTRMEDLFHNWVNVSTSFFSTGVPSAETITDSRGRTHFVVYGQRTNSQRNYKSQIDTIALEAFERTSNAHTTRATWTFHYDDTNVDRFRIPNSAPASDTVLVPLLTSLDLPAGGGSFEFDYFLHSTTGAGANNQMGCVRKMVYPTRGRLEWDYSLYANAVDTCGNALDLEATPGVKERRFYNDATTTTATATWKYDRVTEAYSDVEAGCGHFPANRLLPEYLSNRVTRPDGAVEKHYFSTWPSLAAGRTNPSPKGHYGEEVGSPFTRWNRDTNVSCGRDQLCLSLEVFADSSAASKKRSSLVRYENDESDFRPTYPNSLNRRMQAQQTIYHDDGGVFTKTDNSNFDGFGHYRQTTSSGNFGFAGDLRTSFTRYNPDVPAWPNTPAVTWNTPWLFTNRDQTCVRDGDASPITDCLGLAGAAVTQFHMDASGFLVKERTLLGDSTGETDLLLVQTHEGDGFPTRQQFFGGDRQTIDTDSDIEHLYSETPLPSPVYDLRHTYSAGSLATSRYFKANGNPGEFFSLNNEIDVNTGLVKKTIDPSGITTRYSYDDLSRLASVNADGLALTSYGYDLQPGSGAKVTQTSASTTGSILTEYEYDGLGRVTRQTGSLEDGTRNSVRMVYDGMNRKTSQTEPAVDGEADGPSTTTQYDIFNRPTLITFPDAHNATMQYDGVRTMRRTRSIGTSWNGSNVGETSVTDTETRDALGRLVSLQQSNNVTATYDYDQLDRMIHVRVDGPGGGAQDRSWEYDNRGFLTRVLQPESNQIVFDSFDARGNAWGMRTGAAQGPFDVNFQFDYAERMVQAKEGGGQRRLLKEFTYDSTSDAGHQYSAPGKLVKAVRHNWVSLGGAPASDKQVTRYVQYSANGRISKQSTVVDGRAFTQNFPYNDLGSLSQLKYPTCDDCGVAKSSRDISLTYGFGQLTRVAGLTSASQLIDYWPNGLTKSLTHVGPGGTNPVVDSQTLANGMSRPGSISFTGIDSCATADTTITAPASITASASGSASVPATPGATYSWSVTGGTLASPANGTSITFTAGCLGNVTVTVTTTSSCGAVSSASKQVAITQPAAIVSGGGSIPPGGNATIQVVLTGVAPFRVTWSDGVVQTGQPAGTVTRTVSPTASTTWTATATDAAGCAAVSSGSAAVTITGTELQAAFTVTCSNRTCQVHSTSTGSITRWQWNWGDGTPVIEPGPGDQSHTYANSGNYTITHIVFNSAGNSSTAQRSVLANTPPAPGPDSATTCRSTAVTIDVLANDSDPDGDPLTFTIPVAPAHGSVTIVDGSRFRYTPTTGFVGTDSLEYDVTDTFGGRSRAVVTITVVACGKPVARNDHATTQRDTPVTINLLENDRDPDNQAIGLTSNPIRTQPRHGTVAVLSLTSVQYTPELRWGGNDVFEYEIADASGNKDRAWVAVHVGRTRSLPVAVDDTASTTANRGVTIDVLANDSSPDGDPITLTGHPFIRRPLHGRVTRVSDSRVSYTPQADWTGTDTFAYEISDSEYRTAAAFVTVTVTSENRPPVANPDSAATGAAVSVTIDVTANDTDPDGDPVTLVSAPIVVAPQHGSATRVSASSISYTPAAGYVGTDTFEYEISDGHGRTARGTVTITIANTNHPPEAFDDETVTTAGVAVTIEVTANDSDVDGDQVSLITNPIITPPAHGTAVKVNGSSITYTPASGYSGTDRFQYEIGDHNGARARAWVDITIGAGTANQNPVAVDDEVTMLESNTKDFVVTANDSDPDGDVVSLITSPVIVAPAHGTATRLSNTTIRYTPVSGYVGMDTLQYEIGDGRGKRARAWLRVMVREANSPPVAVGDEASTAAGTAVTVNVTSNDYDPDGDVVRLLAASSPIITPPANGTATKVDADSIRYVPQAGFGGTDRFQYEISDGRGGRHRAWVNITVSGSSGAILKSITTLSTTGVPPLAGNDAAEAFTDTSVAIVVLSNDLSASGRQVVLTASPIVTPPLFGTAERASDTTLTYTPSTAFRGNDRLEYEVVDADGVTTTAWVTVQIPGDNEPPVAVNDVATAAKDGSVAITPATNDTDENGDALILTVRAVVAAPQNGTVRRESDTQLLYSPSPGFTGDDSFVYEITDRRGGSAQATVVVHVIGGAQTPVAQGDSATVQSGRAVAVNVVANDSDPDGDPVRVVASQPPQHGTILWSDGTATYQSHSGYVGPDSFMYTISDPSGLSAQGTVSITVVVVNNPTIAANDSAETKTRTPVLIGVLANDWDPDGQKLTIASVTQPVRGTVVISTNRLSVTYTPANDFAGTEAFQYTVTDGPGSVTASATVTVLNQAPLPRSEILAAPEDTWVGYQSFHVLGNDVDPDGDELHIVSVEQPAHGQFLISPDSSQFSYKSKPDWSGMDSFYYTVGDPFGAQVRVFSQIGVSAVNDAPVANDDSFSVYKNQVLSITQAQIVANDTDIEGHAISVYSVGPATNGTTRMLADGSIEYVPYGEFVGTDSFEYTAQDSGGSAYATARIAVTVLQDTKPVADFTVTCNGFVCAFDASASTDDRGIVSYQWLLKTGAPSSTPAAGKTFSLTYPSEGVFEARLTVEDVLGQTAAAVKWVTVCAPPGIASQPASQTIFAGYTATLSVTAGGTGPFSYQWYEGAAGTTTTPVGPNSSTWTTPGLTATKSYWVRVTSTCSGSAISVNSNTATVTICQLPGIATQPASKTINAGSTATLSVVASGNGPFSYQWYDADTNTYVGNGSTYTTPALTATKSYWVRVTSTCNGSISVISSIATVTVCDPPVITTHPAPKLINAGATATLTVAASGSGTFSYQWFEGPSGTTTTPVGTNSDSFTTPALTATKTYWARVTSACNGNTANSNAATVTVCSPPGFATQPASKTIPTGSSTTLTVVPGGSGPFSYQWYEGAAPTTTTPVGTNSSSYTTPVLTTNKSYWVRVTSWCNGNASANSSTATITMTCAVPPSISASPASRLIVAGQSTTLSVTASGFGPLTYQWYQGTAPSTTTPVGTNSSSLTVTPGATTNYWVRVSNACGGTASATATVTVCNPPVISSHPASTTINYNATATLSVVVGGTGPFSYQWYEGASGVTTTPVGTNSPSFTTPPLAATKSYWVRVSNACSTNSNAATVTVNGAVLARRQFAASTANSQLTITTSWTQPTQAGTLLVAIVSAERSWYPIANWQPPAGWQLAVSYEMSYVKTSIYYYPNNPGGRTAETFGNGGYYDDMILQLAEYTGVVPVSPLDRGAFNGNMSNDGFVDTGYTPQTSQAKELVITALTSYSMTEFYGPSLGFIELDDRNQGWGRLTTAVHEKIVTTAGSWGHSTQVTDPSQWVGVVVTFKGQ